MHFFATVITSNKRNAAFALRDPIPKIRFSLLVEFNTSGNLLNNKKIDKGIHTIIIFFHIVMVILFESK